jgi:hypothetical protein
VGYLNSKVMRNLVDPELVVVGREKTANRRDDETHGQNPMEHSDGSANGRLNSHKRGGETPATGTHALPADSSQSCHSPIHVLALAALT